MWQAGKLAVSAPTMRRISVILLHTTCMNPWSGYVATHHRTAVGVVTLLHEASAAGKLGMHTDLASSRPL